MTANGGGYYSSPYASVPFPVPNNYGLTVFYHSVNPQPKQKSPVQMPASTFKLYDLDAQDQSEIIRLIFAYVGVVYKDKRLKKEAWEKIQTKMPFDQLPILRVDNQLKIFQLPAIIRYLAREFQLYGATKHDHAIVDVILECIRPFQEKISEQLTDWASQEAKLKEFITKHTEIYLKQMEKLFESFHRQGPFYLGSHASLVDLVVYSAINSLIRYEPKLLDNYPHLRQARRRLEKHPEIQDYLSKKIDQQNKAPSEPHHHQTKSPTSTISHNHHHHHHHHHHRHRSHDEHLSSHHSHRYHHHHRQTHSKEPTPIPQKKRTSKSPSISKRDKEPANIISAPPPINTATTEPTVN